MAFKYKNVLNPAGQVDNHILRELFEDIDLSLNNDYLPLTGGTVTGNLIVEGTSTFTGGVDSLFAYRRPILGRVSATEVEAQESLTGTSGDVKIVFPDGTTRITNNGTLTRFDITRNAVLSGSKQSGLRTSLSEANNTWYNIYAVKATDSDDLILVGDTIVPASGNFATLNSNFGTNGWRYLGLIRNGDSASTPGDIVSFEHAGPLTIFDNEAVGSAENGAGILLADSASATSLTYTFAEGTGDLDIPNHIEHIYIQVSAAIGATGVDMLVRAGDSSRPYYSRETATGAFTGIYPPVRAQNGINAALGTAKALSIYLRGFIDPLLNGDHAIL